jgi:FKBP-type peptidyl-prolyl cis-trans isomerase FklB
MKLIPVALLAVVLLPLSVHAGDGTIELKTPKDKVSYAIGMSIGHNFVRQKIDVDPDIVARGAKDAMSGANPMMTEEEAKTILTEFQKGLVEAQEKEMKTVSEKNAKEGTAFLAENGKKKGVVTLKSGLQYKIVTPGKGKMPKKGDSVTVNYRGTLIDGTEFDSSYKRGEPATFPVDEVIAGWTEALQLMKEGSKWHLFIPSNLAYGERGAGQSIGPNATLIFEVELISIAK